MGDKKYTQSDIDELLGTITGLRSIIKDLQSQLTSEKSATGKLTDSVNSLTENLAAKGRELNRVEGELEKEIKSREEAHKYFTKNQMLKDEMATLQAENKKLREGLAYIDKHFTCPCDSQPSGCGDSPNKLCGLKQIVIGRWNPGPLTPPTGQWGHDADKPGECKECGGSRKVKASRTYIEWVIAMRNEDREMGYGRLCYSRNDLKILYDVYKNHPSDLIPCPPCKGKEQKNETM